MKLISFGGLILFLFAFACKGPVNQQLQKNSFSQTSNAIIGGAFENREFMYIGMPENINAVDTSAGWQQTGRKLILSGTIFQRDGKTPASNVILYYYHTDVNGYYANKEDLDPRVARHGYLRGWVKSDENGKYVIYTIKPAPYPNQSMPAHIHPAVKEPNSINEYYIDEIVFDDDTLLTVEKRKALENRGGSGITKLKMKDNVQLAKRNIILGLNIPGYPKTITE